MLWVLLASIVLIVADQVFKWLAVQYLSPISSYPIIEGVLHLNYVENRGAVFGILQGNTFVLVGVTSAMIIGLAIAVFGKFIKEKMLIWALCLIISGGIGNLIDRIFRKFVVDYIYFVPIDFPVFNLADICVVTGTCLIIIYMLFIEPKRNKIIED